MIEIKINDDDRKYAIEILKILVIGLEVLMVIMKNNTQV